MDTNDKFYNDVKGFMNLLVMRHLYEGILFDGIVLGHIDPNRIDTDDIIGKAIDAGQGKFFEYDVKQFLELAQERNEKAASMGREKLSHEFYTDKTAAVFMDFLPEGDIDFEDDGYLTSMDEPTKRYLKSKYGVFLKIVNMPGDAHFLKKIEFRSSDSGYAEKNSNKIIAGIITGFMKEGDDITDYLFARMKNKAVILNRPIANLCQEKPDGTYILKDADINGNNFLHAMFDAFSLSSDAYNTDYRRRVKAYFESL